MTQLITIPQFARATGLSYRLCLALGSSGKIPSVEVGGRRRIDVRWVDQWLAAGGYRGEYRRQKSPSGEQDICKTGKTMSNFTGEPKCGTSG
jgi:excisionase family DNA binding protein